MSRADLLLSRTLTWNNDRVRRHASDRFEPNPRRHDAAPWQTDLEAAFPQIRAEWDAFCAAGGTLPLLSAVVDEHQGNEGEWRAGLLISRRKPATLLADRFPRTVDALAHVPGLWSALWSVFEPGTELPTHTGPNAGMLRYHLGIDCGNGAALEIDGATTPYRDGHGILFDDTVPHAAWNRGETRRVTLFCELLRPIHGPSRWTNHAVQALIGLDPRYRRAPGRADEWERAARR